MPDLGSGVDSSRAAHNNMLDSEYHNKKRKMLKLRSKNKKVKSKAEIEAIEVQRKLQRDAYKAEQAQKQVNFFAYQLYEYLYQMRKCCFVSEADK